jgi:Carboxypeptidase regulatory-like domain/Putative metal-binding motif/Bacterial Ig domain
MLRRILSLARNAAIYRFIVNNAGQANVDPIPILSANSAPITLYEVRVTSPAQYCWIPLTNTYLFDIGGGTYTSFGTTYPGCLGFPKEYTYDYGVTKLIDWKADWKQRAVRLCPEAFLNIGDYFHPLGIKYPEQRRKVYEELLNLMILQDGVASEDEWAQDFVDLLRQIEPYLQTVKSANLVRAILDYVGIEVTAKILTAALSTHVIPWDVLVEITRCLNPQHNYTGIASKLAPVVGNAFSAILSVASSGLRLGGDAFASIVYASALFDHGRDVLVSLDQTLFSNSSGIDPELWAAFQSVKGQLSSDYEHGFWVAMSHKMMEETLAHGPEYAMDAIQIGIHAAIVAGALAPDLGITKGAAAILTGINLSISIVRGGVGLIFAKLEKEELQQAVAACATLEHVWWQRPLSDSALPGLSLPGPATCEEIDRINWLISSKIYQAIFVTEKVVEGNDSGLIRQIAERMGHDGIKRRRKELNDFRGDLIKLMLGKPVHSESKLNNTVRRLAGRPRVDGEYIGFVPKHELKLLIDLTRPEKVFADYGLKLILNSPGQVGIIDPAGRRLGTFVRDDGNENLVVMDINEIPGATYSGSDSHPREIFVGRPIVGNYEIRLMGTGTGPYTLKAQMISATSELISEQETTGVFEPGRREDGVMNADTSTLEITSVPAPRGNVFGTVADNTTGDPIEGARVTAGNSGSITGSNGAFEINNVLPGTFIIKAEVNGYQTFVSNEIVLPPGETLTQNIQLTPVQTYYVDRDGDGFGSPNIGIHATEQPEGFVTDNTDCDDSRADIHPGADEICDDGVDNNCDGLIDEDPVPPEVQLNFPQSNTALQDGVIFTVEASDNCGIANVYFYLREPGETNGISIGYEDLAATLNESTGAWEYGFDTTQLQDGYYVVIAKATDTNGNEGWSTPVPVSIRNWAVVELLPNTANNKAGRTMPVKFALRIAAAVDPAQPFVYNQELEIRIYDASEPDTILLQASLYGDTSTDYRIDTAGELYITNFKSSKTPADYVVEIWRMNKDFKVGDFTFKTVK